MNFLLRGGAAWSARQSHKLEVGGSNPPCATTTLRWGQWLRRVFKSKHTRTINGTPRDLLRPFADNAPASPRFNQSVCSDNPVLISMCSGRGDHMGWFYAFVPMTTLGTSAASTGLVGTCARLISRWAARVSFLIFGANPHVGVGRTGFNYFSLSNHERRSFNQVRPSLDDVWPACSDLVERPLPPAIGALGTFLAVNQTVRRIA